MEPSTVYFGAARRVLAGKAVTDREIKEEVWTAH
jgi:hypothetical protein